MEQIDLLPRAKPKTMRELDEANLRRVTPVDPSDHIDLTNAQSVPAHLTVHNTMVLMACSATKNEVLAAKEHRQELPLFDLYDGPMWQTLRTHTPGARFKLRVVVLSGKYGITGAGLFSQAYESRLSPQKADTLIRNGLIEQQNWFGELDGHTTAPLGEMASPYTSIASPEPVRRLPWRGVIVAAGGDYRRVFMAMLRQLGQAGHLAEDVAVLSTVGGIGEQRQQLGQWLDALIRNTNPMREAA